MRVIATRTNAPDSAASTEATGTPPHPAAGVPGSVTATPSAVGSLTVTWSAAANADGYKVQWKSGSQTYDASTRQATATGTSHTIAGLTAGTTYTVRVIATRTNAPDSAASTEATGTPPSAAGVPGSVTATPSAAGSLTVTWSAAANADGYKVQWKSGAQAYNTSDRQATASGTSHTITGLTAGTTYTVRVIATRTNAPDSTASTEATGTPPSAAGVPGSVTATPSAAGSLTVTWSAAANADGYKVQWKSGSETYNTSDRQATASGTSHTITGLSAGTTYTVRVIATRTNAPDSAASTEATGTPPSAAGVPGSVTATPGVGSLTVTWSAAANADGYKVQWKSGSQSYDTATRQATATGTSHTITGLTAGTEYTVRVIATRTNAPDSAASSEATGTAQHPAAGVPGGVTATPAVGGLTVSWNAAANAGGYKVQWKSGSQTYDAASRQATASGTSHTITGLTGGTEYTVRVIATRTNAPDSAASSDATGTAQHPAAGVPGGVTATPSAAGSLTVSWNAAANADGYKVQWKSGSETYNTSDRQATATGTSHTIAGLTAGTTYTVRVIATRTNAPDSATSTEATGTPPSAAGVPGSVTATPSAAGSLTVTWSAAANADGYKVQWKSGAQAYNTSDRQATASGTSHTITGLTAGTTYTVRVIATRTNAPDSTASTEATGTPPSAAGVPGSVTATPSAAGSLTVSWSAAANADGYKVQWKSGSETYNTSDRQATATGTSHTITGLTAGTTYTVRVIATRTNAPDSAASTEATGTPPSAAGVPGSVTATPSAAGSLTVTWSAAANAGGYKVQWKSGAQAYDASARQATATGTSHTITGLTAGTTYTVRVIATRTNAPDSAASTEATGTPPSAAGVPGSVTATPSAAGSLTVSWSAAANADGYKVQWKSGSQAYNTSDRQATATGTSHTITGLTAGTTYTVRVIATRTNAPDSTASTEATGTPPSAAGVPGSVTATPSAAGSLTVSWSAAANADGYKVQWKSGSETYNTSDRQATATGTSHTITGLTAGTTYTVRVIATRTNAPDSTASTEATGTPPSAAGVPGSVTATPSAAGSLTVTWSAAANADGYKVQWKSGSETYNTSDRQATATGTSHTITGLSAGTTYTVRVIATRTNAPDSAASTEATGTPPSAAGVPGSVTATPGVGSLTVSWSAAANAGGYKVQWKSGSQAYDASTRQATASGTSHTITGLTGGTEYTVRVIATRTNAPDSAASSDATGTAQHPAAGVPGGVTATPAVGGLTVSWNAAANAGGYKVQWKSGAQAYDAASRQATASGTSHTITGLTGGTEYTVRVIATRTDAPDSAASSDATGTAQHPAAGVPGGVTATPAVGGLTVSWNAAANAGGYKVQWKSGSQTYDAASRQATASGTSHTITGLTGGTEYTVRVIATRTNAPDSAASSEATGTAQHPAAGVPGSVTATPSAAGSLTVSWSAAANADGYKVQWKSGGQSYDTSDRQATASGTSHTITGLTAGTTYTVRVIATRTNAPDSTASTEATGTPPSAAGVPGSVTATPSAAGSLTVSWSAAANADGYKVQWKSGSQTYNTSDRQATASGTSHTITGLSAGTTYTVRVIATRTNAPDSAASTEATGTPPSAAGVPGSVTATPGVGSLTVTWSAAANADGYKVQWKSGSQTYNTSDRQATASGTSHTITGLTAGTEYTVRVIATRTNAPDSAASSEATGTAQHPAAGVPGGVTATPAVGGLTVSWNAAANAGGYKVQWKSGAQAYDAASRQATASGTSHTITGLTGGTEYTVRVIATRTNAPDSAASSDATGTAQHPAAGVPGGVTATPAVGGLTVSWNAAANAGGYKVQWKSGSQTYDAASRQATASGTSHTITGLTGGTEYTVRVIATRTNAPDSAASSEATGTAQHPAAGVPGSVTATPTAAGSLRVTWSAAANAGGYKVQWKSGSQAYNTSDRQATASGTSHTITGLTAGTTYTVRVIATRTNAPDSAASTEATGTPPAAAGVPGSVTATPGVGSLTVSWSAAANANGYKVQWKSGSQAYDASTRQATASGTSHTITGLTGGTEYTVRVIATRTNAPDSAASSEATGTAQHPAAGVPGNVTATPSAAGSLTVSWTAPANADGYKVQWKSGAQAYDTSARQATASGTSHTITGLTAGTEYTVRVIATRTNAPDSAASSEATGTPPAAAGVPGGVTATPAAAGSLTVSWSAAANAGGYKVQWKSGSQAYNTSDRQATASGTSHTITGLTAGTTYTVRVIATRTNAPDSAASTEATGTPPPAAGVPGSVTATPGVGSLTVSWSAAANAGGYKVQWKSGAQAYDASTRQATASGTSHTITGLTGGTEYTVRVIATRTNAPDSAASSEATGTAQHPAAGVPGGVTATPAAAGSLRVSWTAPANANGYKVQWKSGGQSYDTSARQATASGTSHTITGLTAGTEYTVRVIATRTNAPDSAASSEATGTPPSVGLVLSKTSVATREDGTADTFTVKLGSQPSADVTVAVTSDDTTEAAVSPASLTFDSTNWGTPQTVTVTGQDDSLMDAPQNYTVTLNPSSTGGDTDYDNLSNVTVSGTNADDEVPTVTGVSVNALSASPTYTFERGERISIPVTFSRAVTVTGTPQLALDIGEDTRRADYARSGVTFGGRSVLYFEYAVRAADRDLDGISIAADALTLNGGTIRGDLGATDNALLGLGSHAITNQPNRRVDGGLFTAAAAFNLLIRSGTCVTTPTPSGTTYGLGDRIEVSVQFLRQVEVTGTPQLALTIGSRTRQADYDRSEDTPFGRTFLYFGYEVRPGDMDADGISFGANPLTLNGGSINDARDDTEAAVLTLNPIQHNPCHKVDGGPVAAGVPDGVTVTPGVGSLTVSWTASANADGYKVQWKSGDQAYDTSERQATASGTSHTITGLTAGTEYTVRVIAVRTDAPDSRASSEETGTAQHPAAGVPGGVTVTPGVGSLTVSWTAAADADGYKVQWRSGDQDYDTSDRQATATGTGHTITGLTAGTEYTVRVIAVRTDAPDGAASEEATGTPQHATLFEVGGSAGTTSRVVKGRTVTVVVEEGVPAGIDLDLSDLPEASGESLTLTFSPVADPPTIEGDALGPAGSRTVVDVSASVGTVPSQGVRLCLPVSEGLRSAADGRRLFLLHYDGATWSRVPGSGESGGGVCASGIASFSIFAVGYNDTLPVFPSDFTLPVFTADRDIGERVLPSATGGDGPLTYALTGPGPSGALPPGLRFDAASRTLSGTPTEVFPAGTYRWTATDRNGRVAELVLTIKVEPNLMPSFGDARVSAPRYVPGTAIEPLPLPSATGGNDPLTYTLTGPGPSGALPEGLAHVPPEDASGGGGTLSGTPAAAGNAVLTLTATDADGDTATLTFTVEVAADLTPTFGDARVPAQRYMSGMVIEPLVLPAATGGNGPLTYALSPMPPEGLAWTPPGDAGGGGTLTGTPTAVRAPSAWTLTARDADGDTAMLTFTIEVADRLRERLGGINAAILPDLSRAMAASTADALSGRIGRAFAPGGGASGRTTSAGMAEAFAGMLGSDGEAIGNGTWSWRRALDGRRFALALPGAGDAPASGLGAAAGAGDGGRARVTLWGAGDYRSLDGGGNGVDWDGHLFGAHLGADARFGTGGLAGLAVSVTGGRFDYTDTSALALGGTVGGEYESRMTGAHPYVAWSWPSGAHAWASFGYARGEITVTDREAGRQKSDGAMRSAAAGGSVRLHSGDGGGGMLGPVAVDLKGEAWGTRFEVEDNGDRIAELSVGTHRVRVSAEGSRSFALSGRGTLTPSVELGMRLDGGDGETGAGVELGGGVDYAHPGSGLVAELGGRMLVSRAGGSDEWGVRSALRLEPASSLGLSLRLAPSYGVTGDGLPRLWEHGVAGTAAAASDGGLPGAHLDAEMGYGLPALAGTLTPYGGLALSGAGTRGYRVGARLLLGPAFELGLEGEHREDRSGRGGNGLMLRGRASW